MKNETACDHTHQDGCDYYAPKVEIQGKAVVESDEGDGYLVMLPDGEVRHAMNPAEALRTIKKYAEGHGDKSAIRALVVEWRDVADLPAEVVVAANPKRARS